MLGVMWWQKFSQPKLGSHAESSCQQPPSQSRAELPPAAI